MRKELLIASRGSRLALTQSNWVADRLRALDPNVEVRIEIFSTAGDRILDTPLSRIGAKGLFTKELEVALLDGRADLAVHSLKDLPTVLPDGLALGAVPPREDPRDALISPRWPTLDLIPAGSRIGTSSLRRSSQLRFLRPDLEIVDLRGNIETRLRKIDEGTADAGVLACAGLHRLGYADCITQVLGPEIMISAVSQGALGIEIRAGDTELREFLHGISDPTAEAETRAERRLLAALEGGCQVPIGALGRVQGARLELTACVASLDGTTLLKTHAEGDAADPEDVGRRASEDLLSQGAGEIIAVIR